MPRRRTTLHIQVKFKPLSFNLSNHFLYVWRVVLNVNNLWRAWTSIPLLLALQHNRVAYSRATGSEMDATGPFDASEQYPA
jgi:hypothetical protein